MNVMSPFAPGVAVYFPRNLEDDTRFEDALGKTTSVRL